MPSVKQPAKYAEESIRVLKGLEPVKQRPGMYTRTESPLHVIQEVIDNAADEALAGFGKRIALTIHADGSVSVEDDGRGIPFGLHPQEQVPVLEIVYTRLHAGGKFDKGAGGAYSFSGGLHGVGVSVTNALARRLAVSVWREGQVATIAFSGGDVAEPLALRKAGAGDRRQGTSVRVWPDPKYFDSAELPRQELTHLLRSKAVLMPGVVVSLTNEKTRETLTWQYKGGLSDYLQQSLPADPLIPLFEGEHYADGGEADDNAEGEGAAWCVAFTEDGATLRESYVNLIPTVAGGTHESGLKDGLFGGHQGLHRPACAAAQGREADARGRVLPRQLRAVGQGAGPAVPGPDQGAAELARRAAAGVQLQARAGTVAQPARGARPQAGRAGDPPGADAPARQPEGREAQGLRRGRAAGQAHRLRKPRHRVQRGVPGRRRLRGRQRQDGAQQGDAGRAAAARQGAQRLGGRPRPAVQANNEIHDIAVAIGVDPHGASTSPTCRACATARCASCPTPTSTARTSRCCC
jgi:topoisomerase-4 subunit B